jgi:hypothetical protein
MKKWIIYSAEFSKVIEAPNIFRALQLWDIATAFKPVIAAHLSNFDLPANTFRL